MTRDESWRVLTESADLWAKSRDKHAGTALSKAAKDWAAANGFVAAVGGAAPGDGPVFPPYGRSKGQPVRGATRQDLEFYARGCERTLADEGKARWHAKEQALLDAINAELARQEAQE